MEQAAVIEMELEEEPCWTGPSAEVLGWLDIVEADCGYDIHACRVALVYN
jgi:hypothetical protein